MRKINLKTAKEILATMGYELEPEYNEIILSRYNILEDIKNALNSRISYYNGSKEIDEEKVNEIYNKNKSEIVNQFLKELEENETSSDFYWEVIDNLIYSYFDDTCCTWTIPNNSTR